MMMRGASSLNHVSFSQRHTTRVNPLCRCTGSAPLPSASLLVHGNSYRSSLYSYVPRQKTRLCASASTDSTSESESSSSGRPSNEIERSMLVNEDTVYLIFQMDLDTQLQRCLNYEAYDDAQEVRKKRQRVDEAVAAMKERKSKNASSPGVDASLNPQDFASEGLRLRTEMQRAVEQERYKEAAKFRDLLKDLEVESRKSAALIAEWTGGQPPKLRLGQRVEHTVHGFSGVIAGWDAQCCESEDWMEEVGVEKMKSGSRQHFYHVLVDSRDWKNEEQVPVAYVAEELLSAPELDTEDPQSWIERWGPEPLVHPYMYILYLGQDARGDYIPCRQLRDKYNARRRDVYAPGEDGEQEPEMGEDGDFTTPD